MESQVIAVLRDTCQQVVLVRTDLLFARDWDDELSPAACAHLMLALSSLEHAAQFLKLAELGADPAPIVARALGGA